MALRNHWACGERSCGGGGAASGGGGEKRLGGLGEGGGRMKGADRGGFEGSTQLSVPCFALFSFSWCSFIDGFLWSKELSDEGCVSGACLGTGGVPA